MYLKNAIGCVLVAGCVASTSMLLPSVGYAQQNSKVKTAMGPLMAKTAKLGEPKLGYRCRQECSWLVFWFDQDE
jgi:hypothetical protein